MHARSLFVVAALALPGAGFAQQTWAERLGWDKGDRVVILHVDDAGMSHDSNAGTFRSMQQGSANSMSVMMTCPWVSELVAGLKADPSLDAGLHLT
ncbi:MAG: ChbG/HpnK family deacetylase, partial [Acidobacteriota bacterium]